MTKQVTFRYSWLAPSLETQANNQGYTLGGKAEYFNVLGVSYLMVKDYMTVTQEASIRGKIGKALTKYLKPLEEVENDGQGNNQ